MPNEAFHTLVLSAEGNETGVQVKAAEDGTELILVRINYYMSASGYLAHYIYTTGCRRTSRPDSLPVRSIRHDK